jgi:hypothetical protein
MNLPSFKLQLPLVSPFFFACFVCFISLLRLSVFCLLHCLFMYFVYCWF